MSTPNQSLLRFARGWTALVLVASLAVSTPASAEQVKLDSSPYHDAVFLQFSDLRLKDFKSSVAGTLTVQLKEIPWKELLQSISVTVSRLGSVVAKHDGAGTFTFNLGKDETLTLGIYAVTRSSSRHGLYTLDATFIPQVTQVPVPAAGWLLVSGVALLGGLRRRLRPAISS